MSEHDTAARRPLDWFKRHNPLHWFKRHKKLTIFLVILLLILAFVVSFLGRTAAVSKTLTYQFVRTTTLQKTNLTDSVSVNGTVASGSTASVTASDSVKTYKVTAVNVAVGDTVKTGDVIATLDTSDVEKQIETAQQNYNDSLDQAETTYTQSVEDQATNLAQLQEKLDQAQQDYDTLGLTDYYSSMQNANGAKGTNRELVEYYYGLYSEKIAQLQNTISNLQIQLTQAQSDGSTDRQQEIQNQLSDYQNQLSIAKGECSIPELGLQGFDTIAQYYNQIEQLRDALDQAQQNYDNAVTTNSRNVDSAETKLEQASRTSDTLTTLQSTLEDCTLTATMDGTITELNATVGSVCTGTVATIQDVSDLTVEVTIPASSVGKLSTGMQCNITSDATGDAVIPGTLTRIDPVANSEGSFGATVTVSGTDSGLLIGISAQVEIVISEKDDIFTVPRDAVGTHDDGSTYVLRKTGGEGVDMTFEEVTVTTGESNDYYIEISGDDLNEGDVIRSSADLTQGIETTDNTTDPLTEMMQGGGEMGGAAPADAPVGGGDRGPGGGGDMGGGNAGGAPGGM
ncbi:efflux RND transporter periplasmic adaptor subunit [Subdoligranulum variabile]|nr:efflux RND transporter periplasmic adaptor subunit [Subdoligranulum variabile]UWP67230.1 efflux RND transporter periplasmic adaptor subunit [Subdoligranulum variabile]